MLEKPIFKKGIKIVCNLDELSASILNQKLKTYNLLKDFNFAVVVLKLSISKSNIDEKGQIINKIIPKVEYVTPFITKELADLYCKELGLTNKLLMLLPVVNGKIIPNNDAIDGTLVKIMVKEE